METLNAPLVKGECPPPPPPPDTAYAAQINSQRTHSTTSTGLKKGLSACQKVHGCVWKTENRCLFILQATAAAAAPACNGKDVTPPGSLGRISLAVVFLIMATRQRLAALLPNNAAALGKSSSSSSFYESKTRQQNAKPALITPGCTHS